MIVKDFKGRIYKLMDVGRDTTLLECSLTGAMVRIRSWGWDEIGFVKA